MRSQRVEPGGLRGGHIPETNVASEQPAGAGATRASHVNMGSLITSSPGTGSTACPAFRQARRPPAITNTLNPCSLSRCATRALVASRAQVQ
jgi:hypothetical protein